MHPELGAIIEVVQNYGYAALFPLLAFGGPLAALGAGFLSSQGFFSPWIVWPMAVLADLTADCVWYAIGRFGRVRVYHFFQKFFSVGDTAVISIERLFDQHGNGKIIFFSKTTMGLGLFGQFMLILQGFLRIPFGLFLFYNLFAGIVLSGAATFAGYYFGLAFISMPPATRLIIVLSFFLTLLILFRLSRPVFSLAAAKFFNNRVNF